MPFNPWASRILILPPREEVDAMKRWVNRAARRRFEAGSKRAPKLVTGLRP